jgi:predicted Fe-Mo cluster-binding NifX family protein
MRITVPVTSGKLCPDLSHGERFVFCDIDPVSRLIVNTRTYVPPPSGAKALPRWLSERGATTVLAHSVDADIRRDLEQRGIQVIVGAALGDPFAVVDAYLSGAPVTGQTMSKG